MKVPPATVVFQVVRRGGRKVTVKGRVHAPGAAVQPRGKVRMFFEYRKTIGSGPRRVRVWRPMSRFTKDVKRSFRFSFTLRRPGTWRAYARYAGLAPFRAQRTGYTLIRGVR
jgi:hypothetical protein